MNRTACNREYYSLNKDRINCERRKLLAMKYHSDEEYRKSLCEKQRAYYHRKKLKVLSP